MQNQQHAHTHCIPSREGKGDCSQTFKITQGMCSYWTIILKFGGGLFQLPTPALIEMKVGMEKLTKDGQKTSELSPG